MGKELTDEEIAKITTKPRGEFRKTNTAEVIIARVRAETNPLIDEKSQHEARGWFLLGHSRVDNPHFEPPPFPSEMDIQITRKADRKVSFSHVLNI